jgi:DNA replication initiation complex subunit (GINS family)
MIDLEKLANILQTERGICKEKCSKCQQWTDINENIVPIDSSIESQIVDYFKNLDLAVKEAETYTEQSMISDEIKNGHIICEGIRNRRFSKILYYASFEAAGSSVEIRGFTESEKQAYQILLPAMKQAMEKVFPVVN